jgi:hypothetical protein
MSKLTLKLLIDPEKNSLTYSKNFRIFSTQDPIRSITSFSEILDDIIISSPESINLTNLKRFFRYSRNKSDWSLWYEVEPGNLGEASDIIFEENSDFFFELKYMYDDGTTNELNSIIEINEIKLRFTNADIKLNTFSPVVFTSDEQSSTIIYTTDPQFKPYEVDSAIGMYKELSFYTNKMFGHGVVYFRTVPESDSGDFIFKEWTLFKNVDRKCLKVLVPKNAFPSNQPKFTEFGLDFELPFEIHVDHNYFQSIFGKNTHPRQRDFLYFPLINRMYEVTGAYLHRAFMMEPTYWKVSLQKYNPNIDMLLKDDSRTFLDNVIQSAEELFKEEVDATTKDGTMPEQYKTISRVFDSSRDAIHPDLTIRPLDFKFNYNELIQNYYNLGAISSTTVSYDIYDPSPIEGETVSLQNLPSINEGDHRSYDVVLAYQKSGPYKTWRNNALITTDKNVEGVSAKFIRVRGPIDPIPDHDGVSDSGRYIRIEAYSDLSFKKQRNIMSDGSTVKFKIREASVVYKSSPAFNLDDIKNLSFTCMFRLNEGSDVVQFLSGYDNETEKGIKISGQFIKYFGGTEEGDFTVSMQLNNTTISQTVPNLKYGTWYALVIVLSNEFKQRAFYIYSMAEDPADLSNHTDLISVLNNQATMEVVEFELENQKYYIPSSDMSIANIRLFNTMIKEEEHSFILSQQYLRDESKLIIIDNCKPQLNLPYIALNR